MTPCLEHAYAVTMSNAKKKQPQGLDDLRDVRDLEDYNSNSNSNHTILHTIHNIGRDAHRKVISVVTSSVQAR